MGEKYTLLEAIALIKQNPKLIFERYEDKEFIIFRDVLGNLVMKVGRQQVQMPIFNYMHDLWIKKQ